jgi:hypothetical protein
MAAAFFLLSCGAIGQAQTGVSAGAAANAPALLPRADSPVPASFDPGARVDSEGSPVSLGRVLGANG